jgi:hypothetical protein
VRHTPGPDAVKRIYFIFSSRALMATMMALMLIRADPTARESTQKNPKYKQDNGIDGRV